jgi:biotin carboxyl carrier protein
MTYNNHSSQAGIAHIVLVLVVAVVLGVAGYSVFRIMQEKDGTYTAANSEEKAKASEVKIKSLPINIDTYNPATGMAGDMLFPKEKFKGFPDLLFFEYGYVISGEFAAQGQDKANPQPTFLAPVGTKVRALIDGEVVNIPKLYSNDYSIHMKGKGSDLIFETEHVQNVKVKVGDQVKAGAVIAEVSDYDADKIGLGIVEIGILKGGKAPTHVCPSDFLDDSIKAKTLSKLTQLKKDWETFRGDTNIYGDSVIPGCVDRDPITDNNNSSTGNTNN